MRLALSMLLASLFSFAVPLSEANTLAVEEDQPQGDYIIEDEFPKYTMSNTFNTEALCEYAYHERGISAFTVGQKIGESYQFRLAPMKSKTLTPGKLSISINCIGPKKQTLTIDTRQHDKSVNCGSYRSKFDKWACEGSTEEARERLSMHESRTVTYSAALAVGVEAMRSCLYVTLKPYFKKSLKETPSGIKIGSYTEIEVFSEVTVYGSGVESQEKYSEQAVRKCNSGA